MIKSLRAARAILLGFSIAAVAPRAGAQDASQEQRFAAAQKLYDDGAYADAYEEFKALASETGSPNADLYVARCLRDLGRLPEAYEATAVALRHAIAKAEQEPKYAQTRNAAAADLAKLEPKIGKLIVAVANPPEELQVTVNGTSLPPGKLGVPVAATIGEAVVRMSAPGKRDVERRVMLRGGETTTLTLVLETPALSGGLQPSPRWSAARVAGVVSVGLGAAGMVTFAAAGSLANSRYDVIFAQCGGHRCIDPGLADDINGGKQLDLIANVGLGVGIAGLVGGTLLIALGGPKAEPSGVTAWAAPSGGGFAIRGSF